MGATKAMVLSSGGLDSTTAISIAVDRFGKENVSTVSVSYGQKHNVELVYAQKVADHFGLNHYQLNLAQIFQESNCSLLQNSSEEVPDGSYASQIDESDSGIVSTYVPFRNGLMMSAVASLAMSVYPDDEVVIVIGVHADDVAGSAYADCTPEFINAMNQAIYRGTYGRVDVYAPFIGMSKAKVVKWGLRLHTPYEKTWSCYNGGDKPCGKCATCIDRAKAFAENGVADPALAD